MADLTGSVVSAPKLAASTDLVSVQVVSKSGAALTGSFDLSLSRSPADPAAWVAAQNTTGLLTLLVGPGSSVGELASGTWWVHARQGDAVFLCGPFVITGGTTYIPPASPLILDGGAP